MKRITFFIGNGFDINIGLKTKYKDFYQYYWLKMANKKSKLANDINGNYEKWADLELGLGQYTEKINVGEIDTFLDEEDNLEQTLAAYLEGECKKVNIDNPQKRQTIAKQMQVYLQNFLKDINNEQKRYINRYLSKTKEGILYSFINFNYTDTLDKCLNATEEIFSSEIGSHRADNGLYYSHKIGTHIHIHGTTSEEMVVGVNDESQIVNKELCKNSFFKELLLKPETNKRYGQNKISETKRIIDESIIICIFGMSIGETDKMWWEYICKWLAANHDRRLVLFIRKNGEFPRTKRNIFSSENEILEKMKMHINESDEDWNVIRNQINIKINSDMFSFEGML